MSNVTDSESVAVISSDAVVSVDDVPKNHEIEFEDNNFVLSSAATAGLASGTNIPNWLNTAITDRMLEGTSSFQDVLDDLRNVMRQIETGVNSRITAIETEQINQHTEFSSNISRLNDDMAGQLSIINTKVTDDEARASSLNVLESEFNTVASRADSIVVQNNETLSNALSTQAASIDGLESTYNTLNGEYSLTADAVSTLNTKVGITDGVVDGTGLIQSVSILQKQNDGVIETTIGEYDVVTYDVDSNGNILPDTLDLVNDATPYADWVPIESTNAPVDNGELPGRVYKYTDANGGITYYEKTVTGWVALNDVNEYIAKVETLRGMHIGDVYIKYHTDSTTGEKVYDNAYKFIKTVVDETSPYGTDTLGYTWSIITDTDSQNAFIVALQAKDLADGKRRIFVDKPASGGVYDTDVDIGDMWLVGSDYAPTGFTAGDILRAKNNKLSGNTYSDSDWMAASRYTDFISAMSQANELLANQRDGTITSWRQSTDPRTGTNSWIGGGSDSDHAGDLWINDDAAEGSKVATFDGSNWTYPSVEIGKELYKQFEHLDVEAYEDGKASIYSGDYSVVVTDIDADLADLRSALEGKDPASVPNVTFRGAATTPSKYGNGWSLASRKHNTGNVWYISYTLHTAAIEEKIDGSGNVITPATAAHDDVVNIGFRWSGEAWYELKDGTAFGNAEALTKLKVDLGDVAANSTLSQTITAVDGKIDTNFQYDTNTEIDGKLYNSGFGLKTTTGTSSDNGVTDPYDSEFWVKASTFRIVDDTTQIQAFDISGGNIHFNGNVSIYGMVDDSQNSVYPGVRLGDSDSHPSGAHEGDTYYNTTDGVVYSYTSAGWVSTEGKPGFSPEITDNGNGTYTITNSNGGSVTWKDGDDAVPPTVTPVTNGNGDTISYTLETKNNDGTIKDSVSIKNPVKNIDYIDGVSGNYVSYVFKVAATTPSAPSGGSWNGSSESIPSGWTDVPTHGDSDIEWVSKRVYTASRTANGVETWTGSAWSTPKKFYQKGNTGPQGPQGPQGIQGNTGPNGATTYFHVAYSDSSDGSVNFNQSSGKYIGTYVDTTPEDSTSYSDYNWILVKGADGVDGTNGIPGVNGKDGQTSYLHIKYSNDNGSTFTSNSGETVGNYIGTYTDFTLSDSTDVNSYKWAQIKGERGFQGTDGSRGSGWYHTTTSNAINAYPSGDSPVAGDIVITNSNDPANAKAWIRNSSNNGWDAAAAFVHGNMVVDGSITGEKVRTGLVTSTDGSSMVIDLDAGSIYIA